MMKALSLAGSVLYQHGGMLREGLLPPCLASPLAWHPSQRWGARVCGLRGCTGSKAGAKDALGWVKGGGDPLMLSLPLT